MGYEGQKNLGYGKSYGIWNMGAEIIIFQKQIHIEGPVGPWNPIKAFHLKSLCGYVRIGVYNIFFHSNFSHEMPVWFCYNLFIYYVLP